MLREEKFDTFVTDSTPQSRTLGAQLDSLLGGISPEEIIHDKVKFLSVLIELWHNLPCLTHRSIILCLPFYFTINENTFSDNIEDQSFPAVWQLNEDYAAYLLGACRKSPNLSTLMQKVDRDEKQNLLNLCNLLEEETGNSLDIVRVMAGLSAK